MGTGTSTTDTQTEIRCTTCGRTYSAVCDWQQGRCPHHPSLLDQVLSNPYKSRFYNLLKWFSKNERR
jgi:hypothetical protein